MKQTTRKPTIASLIAEIEAAGGDRFVANVIACWHSNPVRKLRGMLRLVKAGRSVALRREIDKLYIDGEPAPWSILEQR